MSDKPLFQDMDETEGNHDPSDEAAGEAALGLAAGAIGPGSGTNPSAPGPAAGIGPAIGATALGDAFFRDEESEDMPGDR